MRTVLDIETCGLPDAADYLEPVSPPANYKKEEAIAAYVAEKRAEQIERAGLDMDLCRVVAIGLQREGDTDVSVLLPGSADLAGEAEMLETFWRRILKDRNPVLVGYNLLSFDIPVLIRRSQYLGVAFPRFPVMKTWLDRYRSPHIDLMQELSFRNQQKYRSLKFYARRFGLEVTDTVKGADIAGHVERGEWDKVESHVRSDVALTMALAQRLGYLEPAQEDELEPVA